MKKQICISVCFGAVALVLSACATVNYDGEADKQITAVTTEVTEKLISWETETSENPNAASYDAAFYDKVESDLEILRIRMGSNLDASATKESLAVAGIFSYVESMRQDHKAHRIMPAAWYHSQRIGLLAQLSALTTYELSLKASNTSGKSSK